MEIAYINHFFVYFSFLQIYATKIQNSQFAQNLCNKNSFVDTPIFLDFSQISSELFF